MMAFCEHCRGVVDLQLCYSAFGALLFKCLEKRLVNRALTSVQTAAGALERGNTDWRPTLLGVRAPAEPRPKAEHLETAHGPSTLGARASRVSLLARLPPPVPTVSRRPACLCVSGPPLLALPLRHREGAKPL
jgi:hypothetical protein